MLKKSHMSKLIMKSSSNSNINALNLDLFGHKMHDQTIDNRFLFSNEKEKPLYSLSGKSEADLKLKG